MALNPLACCVVMACDADEIQYARGSLHQTKVSADCCPELYESTKWCMGVPPPRNKEKIIFVVNRKC